MEAGAGAKKVVLKSKLAGSWYSANPERLAREIQGYLNAAPRASLPSIRALILPHAGYRYSGQVAAHGVKQVAGNTYRRVIVIGPSHRAYMKNTVSLPDATHYATPLGEVPLDTECMDMLLKHDCFRRVPNAHEQEHSVQIEIPLLQQALGSFLLVPLVVGQLDLATVQRAGDLLKQAVEKDTLVVASTDFTHYGRSFQYVPFSDDVEEGIRKLDMGAFDFVRRKDLHGFRRYCERTGATICGRNAVAVLIAMCGKDDGVHLLKYDTSGRMAGDFGHSVSYLCAAVTKVRLRKGDGQ